MKRRVLVLMLLAPLFGEVLPGSTPPLALLNPPALLYNLVLYGAGAVLVREIVRRRGLGWANVLILGAAYGVLEEGLVVTSWFNPVWPDTVFLHGKASALGVNWIWAIGLTMYHAVVSITSAIVVAEAIFPEAADRAWLRRRGGCAFALLLLAASLFGLAIFGFLLFRKLGYAHPPGTYLVALVIFGVLLWLGLRRFPAAKAVDGRSPPGPWRLRALGLAAAAAWFWAEYVLPGGVPTGGPPILALLALAAIAGWLLRRWSRRQGWGPAHRLALVTGVLAFFILLEPVAEFSRPPQPGKPMAGLVVVGLCVALLLWRLARRTPITAQPTGI